MNKGYYLYFVTLISAGLLILASCSKEELGAPNPNTTSDTEANVSTRSSDGGPTVFTLETSQQEIEEIVLTHFYEQVEGNPGMGMVGTYDEALDQYTIVTEPLDIEDMPALYVGSGSKGWVLFLYASVLSNSNLDPCMRDLTICEDPANAANGGDRWFLYNGC